MPAHLFQPLGYWLRQSMMQINGVHFKAQFMREVVAQARVKPPAWLNSAELFDWMLDLLQAEPEEFLDIVNAAVQVDLYGLEDLERTLDLGGSVWRATEEGLVRRVDSIAQEAYEQATKPGDTASTELTEAWTRAYGRDPNPSDAWDHAIKAVEAVLIPTVVPKKAKANLGDVIGQLRSQGHVWKLVIRGQKRDHGVEALGHMLALLWPDPNRHGSVTPEPPATLDEARAVVQLAVTIVQWGRDGLILRKDVTP